MEDAMYYSWEISDLWDKDSDSSHKHLDSDS